MQDPEFQVQPQPTESDPPIIIQGGGSVQITVPPKFKEHGSSPNGKHFRDDTGSLASIQINEDAPITLNRDDKITIYYE